MNQEDVAAEGDRRNIFEWTDPSAYVLADPLYFIKAAKNAVVDLMGPSYRGGSGPSDIYTNPAL